MLLYLLETFGNFLVARVDRLFLHFDRPFFLTWEAHQVHKVKFAIRREGNADTRMQAIEETLPLNLQLGPWFGCKHSNMPKIGGNHKILPTSSIKTWESHRFYWISGENPTSTNCCCFPVFSLWKKKIRTSFDDSQKEAHPEMFAEFLGLDSVHRDGHCWYHLLLETTCVWDMWKMRKCCDILGFCRHLMQKMEKTTKS